MLTDADQPNRYPMPARACLTVSPTKVDRPPVNCNLLRSDLGRAGEETPQWELQAGSCGNEPQDHIVLPTELRARSGRRLLIHARDRDCALRANREQRLLDVQVIAGSHHGLTKDSREIQPCTIVVMVFLKACPSELFCAETRRNLAFFRWGRQALAVAIVSGPHRQ